MSTNTVLSEVYDEREYQKRKYGKQVIPMLESGLYFPGDTELSPSKASLRGGLEYARERQKTGKPCWYDILIEEVCEAFLEDDPARQREEMVQVAAVAVQIIEYLDRKIRE